MLHVTIHGQQNCSILDACAETLKRNKFENSFDTGRFDPKQVYLGILVDRPALREVFL